MIHTTNLPTRHQCLLLMEHTRMPLHIQKHSFVVTEIALYLGRRLVERKVRLHLELMETAALLHDIAKAPSLISGEYHNELGARMLERWGYEALAPIVRDHVTMDEERLLGPMTESLIVNYADKRVKHDQIVTLEERFDDLAIRYGKTPEGKMRIMEKLELYLRLEHKIFEPLSIVPTEEELMELSVAFPPSSRLVS